MSNNQTQELSKVLDTLLEQASEGKNQDSNSLNALLDNVLPVYFERVLNEQEKDVVLKIFKSIRLLVSRSPSLVVEDNKYETILKCIKYFYDSRYHSKDLSDAANTTLIQITSGAFGGKLRNNIYLIAMRDDLIETLNENLKFILNSITNTNTLKLIDLHSVTNTNDSRFSKLSISVRILQVLLETSLNKVFMLQLQDSFMIDNLISRTWFCMDKVVANFRFDDFQDENNDNDEPDDESDVSTVLTQTSILKISNKFDELYSILLNSITNYVYKDSYPQVNHLDAVLSKCKDLLNWSLIEKFPILQITLSETLMKLFITCYKEDNICYYWNKLGISSDRLTFTRNLLNRNVHHDLIIVFNLFSIIDLKLRPNNSGHNAFKYTNDEEYYSHSLQLAFNPFTIQRLDALRRRLMLETFTDHENPDMDSILPLTNSIDLVHVIGNTDRFMKIKQSFNSEIISVIDSTDGDIDGKLHVWIENLNKLICEDSDNSHSITDSQIGKMYIVNAIGRFSCLLSHSFDYETSICEKCDHSLNERVYLVDLVEIDRQPISSGKEMSLAFDILMNEFISKSSTLSDEHLIICILVALKRIFSSYRSPSLKKFPELWNFLKTCFAHVVREIRLLTVKIFPLLLFCVEDEQYESDFDTVLKFISQIKPNPSTFYMFEGVIMSWGEMIMIKQLEGSLFVMLNPLIHFMGDVDEFRSNLAFHELRIAAFTKGITPWKLVEPFVPLISYDLVKKRNSNPNLIEIFCDCIKMDPTIFLNRTQEFTVPRFVHHFTEDHLGFIANRIGTTRSVLVKDNLARTLAISLTSEDKIDPSKIMKILSLSDPAYKKYSLPLLLGEIRSLDLVWELLSLYNSDEMKIKIKEAIIYVCSSLHLDTTIQKQKDAFLNREMDHMILGIAQSFSGIIHDQRGSKPYLVKIQAIRAIRCVTQISKSFETCLSQIMTCLQIALESKELQHESLECLHLIVSNLNYSPLSIIVDLLISYLIQKYKSFSLKCKLIAKKILIEIVEKDPKIIREHPSYVYSLSLVPDFEGIVKKGGDPKNHNVLIEFDRRLKDDNKWVVLQVLDDYIHFLDIHQIDFQKTYINDPRLTPIISSLLSNTMSASNRFSATNTDIPRKCANVLASMGALNLTKFGSFSNRNQKKIVLVTNLNEDKEFAEFSIYFLNNVLVKSFVASNDPQKQLFLAYAMQEHLQILQVTCESIAIEDSNERLIWSKLTNLSRTVLKPLLTSRYIRKSYTFASVSYPSYRNTKKHSVWLSEFTENLLQRSENMKKIPKNARLIFANCSIIIRGQDLTIPEFLLPYVALMMVVYGDEQIKSDIEIEINTILNEDLNDLNNDSAIESLKSCYRSVFSIIDYFREWVSERKKDKKTTQKSLSIEERNKVEKFLSCLPTELLAIRTAQCNSYERAIFNLEQSYVANKLDKDEFFTTIRHMYAEINDTDALQGVLKKFSTESLNDKLLQFQYSDDWRVTHESLAALTELDYEDNEDKKLNSVTSLLNCLDDHCEYDQVLLKLKNFASSASSLESFIPSKDWVLCGLQASIFTGQLEELHRWVRYSEHYPSISSPGSDLSIYYEFAQGLITLNVNEIEACQKHLSNSKNNIGVLLSVSKEISHTEVSNYMVLLHCLRDFETLVKFNSGCLLDPFLKTLQLRSDNTSKDFKINWKIHSLRKTIEKLHPLPELRSHLGDTMVQSSKILREVGKLDLATKSITNALMIGTSSELTVNLELSKLLWSQGDHSQALKILKSLLNDHHVSTLEEELGDIRLAYGGWLEESGNGSTDEVIEVYTHNKKCGKSQYCLGRYYNKLLDAQSVDTPGLKRPEKDFYGDLEYNVIKSYVRSASLSNEFVFEVLPKAVTVWLDYKAKYRNSNELSGYSYETISLKRRDNYSSIIKLIKVCVQKSDLPSFKWYTVLSQLISRMVIPDDPETENVIIEIITKLAREYPQIVLYSIYAQTESNSVERAERGRKICDSLRTKSNAELQLTIFESFQLLEALKSICQIDIGKSRRNKLHLYDDLKFSYKENNGCCKSLAIPLNINFHGLTGKRVEKFITFKSFDSKVNILSSMQRPRRLYITGSDGKRYSILCKPHDDLRKDAKLMEFTTVVDRLLKNDSEADKRKLSIKSYAAVPLNETMGVIEMVDNVRTIRDIMLTYLTRQGTPIDFHKVKDLVTDKLKIELKILNFKKLLNMYKPVLQIWFIDQFPNPVTWYQSRNNYTRSCAVMSIVGYLVGMGDRHGDNIMLNELTGQILHVDFDCLFDKGKRLTVPERVPFRLTNNMTTAMGVNSYEGNFRKSCEVTMRLIRKNEYILMNILETFLYDPIMDWINVRSSSSASSRKSRNDDSLDPELAMDTIRRKIKGILNVKDLDTGSKDSGGLSVSISSQVDAIIQQATSDENLAQMYVGWMSFL